jgi:FtsP/CotA-like multicopper oxidase with cupredoxin domain
MSDGTPLAFSCNVPEASPATPGFVTSTQAQSLSALPKTDPRSIRSLRRFDRFFETMNLVLGGRSLEFWVFKEESGGTVFPSPTIRVVDRDLLQVKIKTKKGPHTIHFHGIEPDAFNDGVGHTSFEADDYTYQWRAGDPGTYFYHCHVNTTLHVQMGLWGALIIDPDPTDDPALPAGYKRLYKGGPVYKAERIWGVSSVDARFHGLNHAAGLCGEDEGLHDFRPTQFLIGNQAQTNGAISRAEATGAQPPFRPPITDPSIALTIGKNEPGLLRIINATYYPVELTIGPSAPSEGPPKVEFAASDGRPYRETTRYSGVVETGAVVRLRRPATQFLMSPAERHDVLVNTQDTPLLPGKYPVQLRFLHWLGTADLPFPDRPVGVVKTTITVNP